MALTVLAHAFGERFDAPLPLWMYVGGGGLAVLASFAAVSLRPTATASRSRATDSEPSAAAVRPRDVPPPRGGTGSGLTAVIVLAVLIVSGLAGRQATASNLLPTAFWVVIWVGIPMTVGVLGDWTGPVNPWAAVARWSDQPRLRQVLLGRPAPVSWPPALGFWPAVTGFLLIVLGELVFNTVAVVPRVTAGFMLGYTLVCAAGGLLFGASTWNTRGEVFSVTMATWGRLGWFRHRAAGRPGFGGGLSIPIVASTSRMSAVLLLLISVTYDGALSTPQWARWAARLPLGWGPGSPGRALIDILLLVVILGILWAVFHGFAVASARLGQWEVAGHHGLARLLPSLMPISYGYLLSHYIQYVAINGQLLLPLLGDPLGRGWNLLPYPFNGAYEPNTGILPNGMLWYIQIVVIVGAHIMAVVIAHRHAWSSAPSPAAARASEWPWLIAMVGYTMVSLWLLAQPELAP